MASITVSTDSNFDDAGNLGLANGEDITINAGKTLTINSDTRWAQNAACPYRYYCYGTLSLDGTTVWWIPYDGGTGNAPAIGATVTGETSGATGELISSFSDMITRTTPGAALASTGFVKLRSKTGTFQDNENLQVSGTTFAVVNSSTGGQRGWIHVVSKESSLIYKYRGGKLKVRGDWFEVGVTSGSRRQAAQLPVPTATAGVWIETSSGSGTYDFYPNVGNLSGTTAYYSTFYYPASTTDTREKVCYITATGVLYIGGTTTTDIAYVPPSGCKIRIPNVIWSVIDGSSYATMRYPAYNATSFTGSETFDYDIEYLYNCGLNESFGNYTLLNYKHSTVCNTTCSISGFTASMIDDIGSIREFANTSGNNSGTITIQNSTIMRINSIGSGVDTIGTIKLSAYAKDIYIYNNKIMNTNIDSSYAYYGIIIENASDITIDSNKFVGCEINIASSNNIEITDNQFSAVTYGNTPASGTAPHIFCVIKNNSSDITIDGFSWYEGMTNVHAIANIFQSTNSTNIEVKNIGSKTSALSLGTVNPSSTAAISISGRECSIKRCYFSVGSGSFISFSMGGDNNIVQNVGGIIGTSNHSFASKRTNYKGIYCYGQSITAVTYDQGYYNIFNSATTGKVGLIFYEKINNTSLYSIVAGTPTFGWNGKIYLRTLNDEIEYVFPYFILGCTAFANSAVALTGTNTGNHEVTYDIDTGSGYSGSFKAATGANLSGETITATTGFKLKVRIKCTTAAADNDLSKLEFSMVTDATSQLEEYPLDVVSATLTLNNLQSGSIVKVYQQSDRAQLAGTASSSTSFAYTYDWTTDVAVYIQVLKEGYIPIWFDQFSLTNANQTIPAIQQEDRVYVNP